MESKVIPGITSPLGRAASGWRNVRLGEITTKIGSGATPTGGQEVYLKSRENWALIRSQNVFDRQFDSGGLAFITDEHADKLSGVSVQPNDLLLNITGDGITFGRACLAPVDHLPACVNQHVSIIRTKRNVCSPGYLLSYLTHPIIKEYIESFNAGGSRRAITKGHIESFEVLLPPLAEQERIAEILGTLDDKIDLNRRMNATLEAMARTMFESWAADIQDRSVTRRVEDLITCGALLVGDGYRAKRSELDCEGLPFARAGNLTTGFQFVDAELLGYHGVQAAGEKVSQPLDIALTSKGTVGRLAQVTRMTPRFVYAPQLCYWRVTNPSILNPFVLYEWMKSPEFRHQLDIVKGQTDMAEYASLYDQRRMKITLPSVEEQERLGSQLEPMSQMMDTNTAQTATLAALRDALLPKLLSGEIRIHDAETLTSPV